MLYLHILQWPESGKIALTDLPADVTGATYLASGAQDLCPEDVAGKLLPTKKDAGFSDEASEGEIGALVPPKDYAAKATPDQKGALSEDFGLEKPAPADD